jgi:hypothetical protein
MYRGCRGCIQEEEVISKGGTAVNLVNMRRKYAEWPGCNGVQVLWSKGVHRNDVDGKRMHRG